MVSYDLNDLLEECIQELRAGTSLAEVLARHPKNASELRPLLEMVLWTKSAGESIRVRADAQALSRGAFVHPKAAKQKTSLIHSFKFRLAFSFVAIIICLVFGLLGTTVVSAGALPGDTLYPVKLAWEQIQINFASGTARRFQLQQSFDQQRVQEVNRLINLGRKSKVSFSGVLAGSKDSWKVDGIELIINDKQANQLSDLQDIVVQVSGETEGSKVIVNEIYPHLVTLNGQIKMLDSNSVDVGGVKIKLNNETDVHTELSMNHNVQITAKQDDDGQLVAVSVDDEQVKRPSPTSKPTPTNGSPTENSNSGAPENTPASGGEKESPAPTSTIQPTTSGSLSGESDGGSGNSRMSPTPTTATPSSSRSEEENKPTPTPTATPTHEKDY